MLWKLPQVFGARALRQNEAAARCGLARQHFERLLHAPPDRISLSTLAALCRGLDCRIEELLDVPTAK